MGFKEKMELKKQKQEEEKRRREEWAAAKRARLANVEVPVEEVVVAPAPEPIESGVVTESVPEEPKDEEVETLVDTSKEALITFLKETIEKELPNAIITEDGEEIKEEVEPSEIEPPNRVFKRTRRNKK